LHDSSSGARISANATRLRERIAIRVSGESRPEWEIEVLGFQPRRAARILSCGEADDGARRWVHVRGVDGA
jgi:hypothetical protein